MNGQFWGAFNDELNKMAVASMTMSKGKVKNGTKDDNKKLDTNETMDAKDKYGKRKMKSEAGGFLEKKLSEKAKK